MEELHPFGRAGNIIPTRACSIAFNLLAPEFYI
jgi:hypothetical protein